ncbi:hypothetical protein DPEC_G00251240 [Dallia pectoralis]|uniref:Uncharacterized protein n=1 Tax=Dallia pectoralis TaxID=75939 RepID=A0ACC2FT84_DALPE|nr:hypothetical protein DPEC_G00251240 [Dallia pectoralis]
MHNEAFDLTTALRGLAINSQLAASPPSFERESGYGGPPHYRNDQSDPPGDSVADLPNRCIIMKPTEQTKYTYQDRHAEESNLNCSMSPKKSKMPRRAGVRLERPLERESQREKRDSRGDIKCRPGEEHGRRLGSLNPPPLKGLHVNTGSGGSRTLAYMLHGAERDPQ